MSTRHWKRSTVGLVLALLVGGGLTLVVTLVLAVQQENAFAATMVQKDTTHQEEWSDGRSVSDDSPADRLLSASERPRNTLGRAHSTEQTRPATSSHVIEIFTNTWSYSTIGLVYDPDHEVVRYAHESQSSSHNPTVYDIDPTTHAVPFSLALSTQNSGWPWQLDNRTGAGYDLVAGTYFLPDYNGDLSYADDNVAEIDAAGNILNVWEMDDEVGSNDSSDGSEIDSIIDIAVVPGSPPRYFVSAAYDDNLVYEISLQKTGTWWTPNSWHTVATCTVPIWKATNDNLGIDYDAENEWLYHSSWDTTTLVMTDLTCENGQPMNLVTDNSGTPTQPFDCPGAGGYNSGVTFIEGSNPPEVWVTDFSSDQTTRCKVPGEKSSPTAGWNKVVDGFAWTAGLTITTETSDTFQVIDVITAGQPFTLTESWDVSRLLLTGASVQPPLVDLVTATGTLTITDNAATPDVVTVTKQFWTRPCTWTQTLVRETLDIEGTLSEQRPFTVTKLRPQLDIRSDAQTEVLPGNIATLTLAYSNAGGYENEVWIRNQFAITTPLVYADPAPSRRASDGSWAEWEVGDLATGGGGIIDLYFYVTSTLSISDTFILVSGIYNHEDEQADVVETTFHVNAEAVPGWEKSVDKVAWTPTTSVTRQVSETFKVVDVISTTETFALIEAWDPDKLVLSDWQVEPLAYKETITAESGALFFAATPSPPLFPLGPITLTKTFTVRTCAWMQTLLWEQLTIDTNLPLFRSVPVYKTPSRLQIRGKNDESKIYSGETVTFALTYSNAGGFEDEVHLRSELPPEVSFVSSSGLTPSAGGPGDATIEWTLPGGLAAGAVGGISVTITISEDVPPLTRIEIPHEIVDHANRAQETTVITYHISPPVWQSQVNGRNWTFGLETPADTGDLITITDIVTTGADSSLINRWNEEQLTLLNAQLSRGTWLSEAGRLTWTLPISRPEVLTLTKWFRVQPFTQTYTVLWEDFWAGGQEWERRPVQIDVPNKQPGIQVLAGDDVIPSGSGNVDFGATLVGVPFTRTFTISSTGIDILTLTRPISVPPGFSVVEGLGRTVIPPAESTTFSLRFDAAAEGVYSGTVSFAHNVIASSPYTFTVRGRAGHVEIFLPALFKR